MKKFLVALLLAGALIVDLAAAEGGSLLEKFPAELVNASGKKFDKATALNGKMVAVYFSASWCGPCRGFTPKLIEFYKKTAKKNNLEIVFVSSDRSADAMEKYMKKMPWLAMPFGSPEAAALKKELKVRGIPKLVVFDANGKLISENARRDVVMLGKKAIKAWKSKDYKNGDGKKSRKKKSRK